MSERYRLVLVDHGPELIQVVNLLVFEQGYERVPALKLLLGPDAVLGEGSRQAMEQLAERFSERSAVVRVERAPRDRQADPGGTPPEAPEPAPGKEGRGR